MLSFFKRSPQGTKTELKISGMHCVSCSMNIDTELEEKEGVIEATTSYAKATTQVSFDPQKISLTEIKKVISDLGYQTE